MTEVHHEVRIDRPVEEVFDFLADGSDNPRWQPLVVTTTPPPGPIGVNSTFTQRARHPLGFTVSADYRITPSQAEVVRVLGERGSLTHNGLGDLLVCESGNSPSRLVDRLVRAGLVERRSSDTDRRTITVAPTRAGVEMASQIAVIEEEIYSFIDAALTAKQRGQAISSLRTLIEGTLAGQALARRIASLPDND